MLHDHRRLLCQSGTGRRQLHPGRGPFKDGKAQLLLQIFYGAAQIWLGQEQVFCCPGRGAAPGDLQNVLKLLYGHDPSPPSVCCASSMYGINLFLVPAPLYLFFFLKSIAGIYSRL